MSVLLELAEEDFDTAAQFVERFVIYDRGFAVLAAWDNRDVVIGTQSLTMRIAVIASVLDDGATDYVSRQIIGHNAVVHLPTGQESLDNVSFRRQRQVQLRRQASTAGPFRLDPPFKPPP